MANPDALRVDEDAVRFVHGFFEQDKPVAVICHRLWTLIEARKPDDLPALCAKLVEEFAEGRHEQHVGGGAES